MIKNVNQCTSDSWRQNFMPEGHVLQKLIMKVKHHHKLRPWLRHDSMFNLLGAYSIGVPVEDHNKKTFFSKLLMDREQDPWRIHFEIQYSRFQVTLSHHFSWRPHVHHTLPPTPRNAHSFFSFSQLKDNGLLKFMKLPWLMWLTMKVNNFLKI